MLRWLETEGGVPVDFRVSETPIFLTAELAARAGARRARDLRGGAFAGLSASLRARHSRRAGGARRRAASGLPAGRLRAGARARGGGDRAAPDRAAGLPLALRLPVASGARLPRSTSTCRRAGARTSAATTRTATRGSCARPSSATAIPRTWCSWRSSPSKQKTRIDFAVTEKHRSACAPWTPRQVIAPRPPLFYRRDGRDIRSTASTTG